MDTLHFTNSHFTPAYGIFCAPLPSSSLKSAIYPTFCKIPMGGRTKGHAHFETEVFYLIQGTGKLTLNELVKDVQQGDLIHLPAFSHHELINTGNKELHFLSVYSEDYSTEGLPSSVLITTAPPTPNGPLHLGHMSGPYLAGDFLRRYLETKGVKVKSLSGTDDQQNYVAALADTLNKDSESVRQEMRMRIQRGLEHFKIHYDEFVEPKTNKDYQKNLVRFHDVIKAKRLIQKESVPFPFCKACDQHLVDAYILGECPECGESGRGSCENCGLVTLPHKLQNPKCGTCGESASLKETEIETFHLSQYLPLIQEDLKNLTLSKRQRTLVEKVQNLSEYKVLLTYPNKNKEETIHVWFEMAAHYEQFFLGQENWVHCFGLDNAFYYLLFIPTLMKALHFEAKLPIAVVTNEFLQLEGQKFSTSRNHAIWADEFKGNVDHLRLYLALERPATQASNFSLSDFETFSLKLERTLQMIHEKIKRSMEGEAREESQLRVARLGHDLDRSFRIHHCNLREAARHLLHFLDLILEEEDDPSATYMARSWANWATIFMPNEASRFGERA